MKSFVFLAAVAALGMLPAVAQDSTVTVKGKGLKVGGLETPQYQAGGVGDRRWRPKTWLELDLEFEVQLDRTAGGRDASLDSMQVNYYVAFNQKSPDGKTQFLKGTFNYTDIPSHENCHALAFVAPATLRKVLRKDQFTPSSDIQGWGYEILVNGKLVAGDTSIPGKKWWESDGVISVDGSMLAKRDTPYSILWGDYDVGVKK
jgi:hypothetical protein